MPIGDPSKTLYLSLINERIDLLRAAEISTSRD